jgi:hypothetical protein
MDARRWGAKPRLNGRNLFKVFFSCWNFTQAGQEYVKDARKGSQTVLAPLDIFKMQEGTYVWKATAETFDLAKSKIEQLSTTAPGQYMIFSQTTRKKIVIPLDAT